MNNVDQQLEQILRNDPELRHQVAFIRDICEASGVIFTAIKKLISVRLPFLAHPAYRIDAH